MELSIQLAIILLIVGLFILLLELFIPSAGTLFMLATACVVASVVVAFLVDTMVGFVFFILVSILAIVLPGLGLEVWKRSPIGRRMILDMPETPDREPSERKSSRSESKFESLRGAVGKTLTPLRPSGMTEFSGQRVDTVAEGVMIERGEYVRVVDVQGNRVVVRRIQPVEEKTWSFETDEEIFSDPSS